MTKAASHIPSLPVLYIGAIGLMCLGLQPEIIAALAGMASNDGQLGWFPFAEITAMAFASMVTLHGLTSSYRRSVLIVGGTIMVAGNVATMLATGLASALASRLLAGFGEGTLATAGVAAVIISATPVRTSAWFVAASAVPQLLGSWVLLAWAPQSTGAVFLVLALGGLTTIPAALLAGGNSGPDILVRRLRSSALMPLCGVALLNAAGSACWSFLDVWGQNLGLAAVDIARGVTICLVAQIAANLLLAWRGPSTRLEIFLAGTMLGEAGGVLGLLLSHSATAYTDAAILFGFAWQAGLPLATGLFLRSDSSQGASFLLLPASLIGIAAGPLLAAANVSLPQMFAILAGLLVLGGVALAALGRPRARHPSHS